jgi:hypothetical protein
VRPKGFWFEILAVGQQAPNPEEMLQTIEQMMAQVARRSDASTLFAEALPPSAFRCCRSSWTR